MSAVGTFLGAAETCRLRARRSLARALQHGNVGRALALSVDERLREELYLEAARRSERRTR